MSSMKLTVAITARNDNHSGDFTERVQKSVTENIKVLRENLNGSFEFVIIDWCSQDDNFLYQNPSMDWVKDFPEIKIIVVKEDLVKQKFGIIRFYQFFAKNVSITKAQGEWLLLINADNIIGESLALKINDILEKDEDKFYRTRWWTNSDGESLDCVSKYKPMLAETYSGDFLLCKKETLINKGRGYNEVSLGHQTALPQAQMDGEILYNLIRNGINQEIIEDEIYHLYHKRSGVYDKEYNKTGYENSSNWGFQNNEMSEIRKGVFVVEKLKDKSVNITGEPFKNINRKFQIGVILTVWNRLKNLNKTIEQLNNQTFKDFDIYIINNNTEAKDEINDIISESVMPIHILHNETNLGFLSRHLLAKKLNESGYEYLIILDDDLEIGRTAFETMNQEKEKNKALSILALNFENNFYSFSIENGKRASKYIGPGAMIIDSSLYSISDFWKKWEPAYYMIDDLWISYFAWNQGWYCGRSFSDIEILPPPNVNDGIPTWCKETTIFLRNDFLKKYKWGNGHGANALIVNQIFPKPLQTKPEIKMNKRLPAKTLPLASKTPPPPVKEDFYSKLSSFFKPDEKMTVFDVGACDCHDSVKYTNWFINSSVYSFEPIKANFDLCLKKIELNKKEKSIQVFNVACGDKNEQTEIWRSSGCPEGKENVGDVNFGNKSSSLLKPLKHTEVHPWCKFEEKETINVIRLDSFCSEHSLSSIDFIHMDVQGFELNVLKGLGTMLKKTKAIYLEVESIELYEGQPVKTDIEKFMTENGFRKELDTVGSVAGDQLWINNALIPQRASIKIPPKVLPPRKAVVVNPRQTWK